jgi:hypothetical protein
MTPWNIQSLKLTGRQALLPLGDETKWVKLGLSFGKKGKTEFP